MIPQAEDRLTTFPKPTYSSASSGQALPGDLNIIEQQKFEIYSSTHHSSHQKSMTLTGFTY